MSICGKGCVFTPENASFCSTVEYLWKMPASECLAVDLLINVCSSPFDDREAFELEFDVEGFSRPIGRLAFPGTA